MSFPLSAVGGYGHNGTFGAMMWVDPKRELVRIFLTQRLGFENEMDIFMAIAGAATNE